MALAAPAVAVGERIARTGDRANRQPLSTVAVLLMPLVVTASTAQGNAVVTHPAWQHLPFTAITAGTGATINGNGDLVFSVVDYSSLAATITLLVTPGGAGTTLYTGYSWDGGTTITQLGSQVQPGAGSVTFTGGINANLDARTLSIYVSSSSGASPLYWGPGSLTVNSLTSIYFPAFTPIYPPPPAGNPVGVPVFPPPTPPPIGTVPRGPLVGPPVVPAPVPPSIPGVTQPQFQPPGSATNPPPSGYWPQPSTTPPYPPVVFANIFTGGATPVAPPSTPSQPPFPPLPVLAFTGGINVGAVSGGASEPIAPPPAQRRFRRSGAKSPNSETTASQ